VGLKWSRQLAREDRYGLADQAGHSEAMFMLLRVEYGKCTSKWIEDLNMGARVRSAMDFVSPGGIAGPVHKQLSI
jgi:hypothetical protein